MERITVVGAGLAGCEAAWQASRLGVGVRLIDMKPDARTPAHNYEDFAELVCSNSLGSQSVDNAKGLLKQELRELGSLIVKCADMCRVPAGNALAVDRAGFSRAATRALSLRDGVVVECAELDRVPDDRPCIIATGPLTTQRLLDDIASRFCSGQLYFFDAASPIVTADSIDCGKTFRSSRYGKGEGGYINCPMTREQYGTFVEALRNADTAGIREFEDAKLFEGCVPVENLAKRGADTLRFGPLKPKGLPDPATGREPYAVVQLRQDDSEGGLYNLVGFQTRLLFGEQRRVFRMIPGLERAEFVRYGVMHKNAYIDSPRSLDKTYAFRGDGDLFFAGQLTGVEGYMESVASGFTAGICAALKVRKLPMIEFPRNTLIGALAGYISGGGRCKTSADEASADAPTFQRLNVPTFQRLNAPAFQPMNANFGLLPPIDGAGGRKSKRERNAALAAGSLAVIKDIAKKITIFQKNEEQSYVAAWEDR